MDTPVFVSHHQFQVVAGAESGDYLELYRVGDDLLQVTGPDSADRPDRPAHR